MEKISLICLVKNCKVIQELKEKKERELSAGSDQRKSFE